MSDQSGTSGLDRRAALRRLVTGAGAAGAAAALPAVAQAAGKAASASPMQGPDAGKATTSGMALGAAEPPDPGLSAADWKPRFFDDHQDQTVLVLADLVIPETDTPGARAAQVDRFIDLLLSTDAPGTGEDTGGSDFADLLLRKGSLEAQKRYIAALSWLDGHCLAQHSKPFTALDRPEQETILDLLTHSTDSPQLGSGRESFALIKSSIVTAYYSSEIGALRELKYQTNPFQSGVPGCDHQEH